MNIVKGLSLHGALLVAASVLSFWVWTKEGAEPPDERLQAEIWGGSPTAIDSVRFESENLKVELVPKQDGQGRYYEGKLEKKGSDAPPPVNPHAPPGQPPPQPPKADAAKKAPTTTRFVAVTSGEKLFEKLAPMAAFRSVGKPDPKRAAEFGLDKPQGTLHVSVGGKKHALVFGGITPGGSDRYAKDKTTGEVWAIPGDVADSFLYADSRLIERDLHGFPKEDIKQLKIARGPRSRELVRIEGKNDAWADGTNPAKADETAGNWVNKIDNLRAMEYVDPKQRPSGAEAAVARIEYFGPGSRRLGHVDIVRFGQAPNAEYYVRTEQTRWLAKIAKTSGEQIEQDVASVLK